MPVYSRKQLRQTLGKSFIRDLRTFNVDTTGTNTFQQVFEADPSLIGQGLYANAWIRHVFDDNDYRVSSFNAGSGAYITRQTTAATATLGDEIEIHSRLSGAEKDLMLDDTIKAIRVQREVGIATGTAGADFFSIEGAASPNYITDVLDVYWFANPAGSLDRTLYRFTDFRLVMTGSGREIRVNPAPGGSAQLVLDAILELTLGALSTATINLPDDTWILAGAAARCYNLMIQGAPGQNAGALADRRKEWADQFSTLSTHHAPLYTRTVKLEEPEDANSPLGLLTW